MDNREIKFRAWDKERNIMEYFNFHNIYHPAQGMDNPDIVLMQYTGLKDENGKEIYEGDILNNGEAYEELWRVVVIFRNGAFQLRELETGDDRIQCCCGQDLSLWKVIGNIHENPELLEVKNEV
jgi:uncharacterized phage protein (TIGR01671 family)